MTDHHLPPNTIRDGEAFRLEACGELPTEYIELVRRSPDEALWHVVAQAALAEAKLKRIRRLVEQWERDSAQREQRPDTIRGWGRSEYLMRSYTAAVYGDVTRALREILDGQ